MCGHSVTLFNSIPDVHTHNELPFICFITREQHASQILDPCALIFSSTHYILRIVLHSLCTTSCTFHAITYSDICIYGPPLYFQLHFLIYLSVHTHISRDELLCLRATSGEAEALLAYPPYNLYTYPGSDSIPCPIQRSLSYVLLVIKVIIMDVNLLVLLPLIGICSLLLVFHRTHTPLLLSTQPNP